MATTGTEEMTAQGGYMRGLADAVMEWLHANQPAAEGASIRREDAAMHFLSVTGTLVQIAANMTQTMAQVGITMSEEQFVELCRGRFRETLARPTTRA
jgi:hypothetical protein